MDHAPLYRPGPHQRHLDDKVIEFFRLEPRQHGHLRPRLNLKNTDRVGALQHGVGGLVLGRNIIHAKGQSAALRNQVKGAAHGGEHAQRQHVNLEQAERIKIILVPLDDRPVRHGGVLHRHQLGQRAA